MRIFVIGFMGSNRKGLAMDLAKEYRLRYLDLDHEIEKADGRNIDRICMTMGEHEYRNKEYEALSKVCKDDDIVVACGDGIILDEMSVQLLKANRIIVADPEKTPQQLWEDCIQGELPPYAFLHHGTQAEKKDKFISLYKARKKLYQQF